MLYQHSFQPGRDLVHAVDPAGMLEHMKRRGGCELGQMIVKDIGYKVRETERGYPGGDVHEMRIIVFSEQEWYEFRRRLREVIKCNIEESRLKEIKELLIDLEKPNTK